MKRFHQYKLSKNDKQIIKNFKLDIDFKELSPEDLFIYWKKILNTKNEKVLNIFSKPLLDMQGYVSMINGNEYFFFDYNEKNFYNIFFYNMNDIKENNTNSLTNSRESIDVFKVICSIYLDEVKKHRTLSYKIKLPHKFSKLYFKLIDKITKELYKNTNMKIKKIKNEYYYYYRGSRYNWHSLRFLRTYAYHYKKPPIDIDDYVRKFKAK